MAEETVNTVNKCFKCIADSVAMCRHCGQDFCNAHRSVYDERCCVNCVSEKEIKIEVTPLVDDEGVTHQGRHIRLIGEGWPHQLEMIRDLTDEQLEAKLVEWRRLLAEAIKAQEFFRITVCAAEFQKEANFRSKVRKLQRRREEIKQGVLNINNKKTRVKAQADPAEAIAKQFGLSLEQARALIKMTAQKGVQP